MYQQKVTHLFGRTRALEAQIDEFLDKVSEAGLVFARAVRVYLDDGATDEFETFVQQEGTLESREDALRRSIETELYARTLIPDLRADVLKLLEDVDSIVNEYEGMLYRLSIQRPAFEPEYHKGFLDLVDTVITCVDSVVMAARAFFRDIETVRDHSAKTIFFEAQADKLSSKIQRAIFDSDSPLDRKMHLQYFVERVDNIANMAEDVADSLQIYTIKRRI